MERIEFLHEQLLHLAATWDRLIATDPRHVSREARGYLRWIENADVATPREAEIKDFLIEFCIVVIAKAEMHRR